MKVTTMQTSTFWKGEVGVKGEVEDQNQTYQVNLYVKGGQVRDCSCSCARGNSSESICAHGNALFAYYEAYAKKASKPPVHTCPEAENMIREYTNRQVADILSEEEIASVDLIPELTLTMTTMKVEFKVGREKLYPVKDLAAFAKAVLDGEWAEYGRSFGFHHRESAFSEKSRDMLHLVTELAPFAGRGKEMELGVAVRDRFFACLEGWQVAVQLPGGVRAQMTVKTEEPRLGISVKGYGRDGFRVALESIQGESSSIGQGRIFSGKEGLYLALGESLYCCKRAYAEAVRPFLTQVCRDASRSVLIGERDMPLFYSRVLKTVLAFGDLDAAGLDCAAWEPKPLQAQFRFDSKGTDGVVMEPCLSYGDVEFHPVEDEDLPRSVCRDVPGEVRISRAINRYFRHKESDGIHVVIKNDEAALYRLLTEGIEEFRTLGEVLVSDRLKTWKVLPPPGVSVGLSLNAGWLDLKVDTGGLTGSDLTRILTAYTQKKKYYRLKTGEFLELGEGGLYTVAKLAGELGLTRKDLAGEELHLPAYRALYLDTLLKESAGVIYSKDQMARQLIRGLRSAEDSDWAIPKEMESVLREYQKTGFRWMKTLDSYGFGGILADDMGLGKTIQVIALLLDGCQKAPQAMNLIVCPASLVYNWEHEIGRFAPDLTVLALVGNAAEREATLAEIAGGKNQPQVLITSYDLLKRDIICYEKLRFSYQIIDEAQYIKNASTQSAKAVKAVQARTRFALTGTPIENRLGELWSIFDYLMPGFLFSQQRFRKEYESPVIREEDGTVLAKLRRLTGPFILRRVKRDVLKELPEKLEQVVYSQMESQQRELYTAEAMKLRELLDQDKAAFDRERFQILAELTRLRQICCDPRLCYDNYKGESAKLETCLDLVRRGVEGEHKILLFSQFTSMLELIEARLKAEDISCCKLTGATSKEERIRMVGEFAGNDVKVFLISLKAGGTGLNLTAADVVIHYDPWWNVAAQNQATDRSHRIGQNKQVTVYKLIARQSVEENILTLQESKSRLSEQVITGEGGLTALSREELLKILY